MVMPKNDAELFYFYRLSMRASLDTSERHSSSGQPLADYIICFGRPDQLAGRS